MATIDISGTTVTVTPQLPSILVRAVADLSGAVHNGADLLRHVPSLAAAAQALGGTGP